MFRHLTSLGFVIRLKLILAFFIMAMSLHGQKSPAFLTDYNAHWVDSVFNSLTLEQKIGQLLMPRGNYSGKAHNVRQLKEWVTQYKIGGIVFFASNPTEQARITNELQALSEVPLLIGQDLEWGLGMRLDSTHRFPYNMTIGAAPLNNDILIRMGKEIARQCKRLGIHVNYAPVVDVNNNSKNPVINYRSFGADKHIVTQNGLALMQGMQSQNILCTAKHFPGHGDTEADSHYALPVIPHSRNRLDSIELFPFKTLIDKGLSGVMTAHLNIPALEPKTGLASTFSYNIVFKLLREELKFQGLTFTDAMEMEGAVKNYPKGESMVRALLAGNDILETFIEVPLAVDAIKKAIQSNRISIDAINAKVKKILKAKAWVGLDKYQPIKLENLIADLYSVECEVINHTITQNSITCLKNDLALLPVLDLNKKIAVLSIGSDQKSDFYQMVKNYVKADYFSLQHTTSDSLIENTLNLLESYDLVLAAAHFTDIRPSKKYGLNPQNTKLLKHLASLDNVLLSILGSPFILTAIPELSQSKTLLIAYQQSKYTETITPQIIFGALPVYGKLPMTFTDTFYQGMGINLPSNGRLSYTIPELAGINGYRLQQALDSIIYAGLYDHAYPGCVLQVAKDGKVIFNKAYGYHTYEDWPEILTEESNAFVKNGFIDDAMDNDMKNYAKPALSISAVQPVFEKEKVQTSDLYDLASLTKIMASAPVMMSLVSEGILDINKKLETYIPSLKNTPIGSVTFKDAMAHRAGLKAWIPFWKDAIDTLATMKKAFIQNPSLTDMATYQVKKRGFFKRLFGVKPVKILDTLASVQQNQTLWHLALNQDTRTWKKNIFSDKYSAAYPIPVAQNMYLNKNYTNTFKQSIKNTPLEHPGKYVYSDLHYYFYPELVQNLTKQNFDDYLQKIYNSIGCLDMTYNPWQKMPVEDVIPTEYDSLFRQQLLQGYVHDEGASMMGGISGHAGLFGTASDVMKMMQMFIQQGTYGNSSIIRPEVIQQFTSYQFPEDKNRRGLIFDKKDIASETRNIPTLSSEKSFGHSGFTGTYTWADPEFGLVYVFLSNRVYPSRHNSKLIDMNIRAVIGDLLIKAIQTGNN